METTIGIKQLLVKHYRIIFYSREGFFFLLLFLTGIARYRVILIFIINGVLAGWNQYLIAKGSKTQFTEYYCGIIKPVLMLAAIFLLLMDLSKGQIFPIYPAFPMWASVGIVVAAYGIIMVTNTALGRLFQRITENDIFTVCPCCGYANTQMPVAVCKNCQYRKGLPVAEYKENLQMPIELQDEINQYKKAGLYKKLPESVIKGLGLACDEILLIALNSYSKLIYKNGDGTILNKYGETCMLNKMVLTNKRICFLFERAGGWQHVECLVYNDIKNVFIETIPPIIPPITDALFSNLVRNVYNLIIKTETAAYILKGGYHSKKDKFEDILSCIRKRNPNL